jgi:hypothetical protein
VLLLLHQAEIDALYDKLEAAEHAKSKAPKGAQA